MLRISILSLSLVLSVFPLSDAFSQERGVEISFEHAVELMNGSKDLKIADLELDWAESERRRLNALWFPQISATGAYVYLGNKIEVKQSLSTFTDPVKDFVQSIDPGEQIITGFLDNIGKNSFGFPLLPRNMTTLDAVATLPVFTGGKRIFAGKIGRSMVDLAQMNRHKVSTDQQVLLVASYFGVRLGQKIVEVQRETCNAMERHLQNALKLEEAGMLTKTERLLFQVNRDEAKRELEAAVKELSVTQSTLKTLLQAGNDEDIIPVSPLFIQERLPPVGYFKSLIEKNNYIIQGLEILRDIQKNQIKIANSAYLPEIAAFGKQTLWSDGIPKNLAPRSVIGLAMTWNIFDGLAREKQIRQAEIDSRTTELERAKTADDLTVAVEKFYSQTQIAVDNVSALQTVLELNEEIVRARQQAFLEGMATSTEVIDAELLLSKAKIAVLMAYYQFDTGLINLLALCGITDSFYMYSKESKDESFVLNM